VSVATVSIGDIAGVIAALAFAYLVLRLGGLIGKAYAVYFRRVLPAIGRVICGNDAPYNYLPTSVGNFPPPTEMLSLMRATGYTDCAWQPYTFGIAGLYTAVRPLVV